MGKSNRIRNGRANATLASVKPTNKKQGMPLWAMNLIAIAITVVVLLSVSLSLVVSNGVFGRVQTAMKTDNFRVSQNTMNYFFQTTYQSFISENSSYLTYYGIDTGKSLKEQPLDTSDVTKGTWFDSIMAQAKAQAQEYLVYCEEAKARGIELDDEDIKAIDSEIEMYALYADMYGYTTNSYIASIFGKGMKASDIRNALELSALATKCSEIVGEEIEGAITTDQVNSEYDENKLDYDYVDFATYDFSVSYEETIEEIMGEDYDEEDITDEKRAEILTKYKEMIAKAKEDAEALAKITDLAEFKKFIYGKLAEEAYDAAYDGEIDDSEDVTSEKLPSDDTVKAIREKTIAHIVDLLVNDKDYEALTSTTDGKTEIFDIEISAEYGDLLEAAITIAVEDAKTSAEKHISEENVYTDTDDAMEWAFENDRKVGDIKVFQDGDGKNDNEVSSNADELTSFSASVYYITKTQYRDETLTKNVGLMLFSTEAAAKTALAKLTKGMTVEAFEALATEVNGSFSKYENYVKGSMGVAAFDTWLYGDDVTIGSVTTEVITIEKDTSYAVAVYYADGDAEWFVNVKSAIFSENFTANAEALAAKYVITTKDKVINKIDG